jgi:pimeloyl-ACP methyl ester carboxylesterase
MPISTVNGIDLYHEDAGDPGAPVILLIMGLGRQIIAWPPEFIADLVARGFRVISFDNRDIGLSTHLHAAPVRNLAVAIGAQLLGIRLKPAYSLDHMAQDALALLDALGIAHAHVVGDGRHDRPDHRRDGARPRAQPDLDHVDQRRARPARCLASAASPAHRAAQ